MLDLALIIAIALFGALLRLPLLTTNLQRFEEGMPPGDMSGVLEKFTANRARWFPNDHSIVSTDRTGTFGYPVLFHWLVSKFPRRRWRTASVILTVVPDLLLGIFAFWLLRADFSPFGLVSPLQANGFPGVDAATAALSALVFLFQPGYLPTTARMKATNGRTFGLFFVTIFLLGAYGAYVAEAGSAAFWISIAVMALAIWLAALSSLFGLQVVVFVGLPLGVLLASIAVVATIAATLALAWVVRGLGVRDIVEWKIAHFFWYRKNRASMTAVDKRRLFTTFLQFWPALLRNPARAKAIFLNDSPLLIALTSFPAIFGFALAFGLSGFPASNPFVWFAACIFVATIPIFTLTSGPLLSELGQAERYWEYVSAFLWPAAIALLAGFLAQPTLSAVLLLVLLAEASLLAITHLYLSGSAWRLVNAFPQEGQEIQVVQYFKNAGIEPALAPIPQQMQRYWPRLFKEQGWRCRMFFLYVLESGQPLSAGFPYMDRLFADFIQIPSPLPAEFTRQAKVDYVIAQKRFLLSVARNPYVLALKADYEPVFENDKYVVYYLSKRKDGQTERPGT